MKKIQIITLLAMISLTAMAQKPKVYVTREIIGELEVGGMVKLDGVSAGAVQASCSAMKSETRDYMTKKMDGGIVVVRVK